MTPSKSKKSHTECYTYFSITGQFDPKEISDMLCLTPAKAHTQEEINRAGKPYGFSACEFAPCQSNDLIIAHQMEAAIAPFLDKIKILNQIKEKYSAEFWLSVVPAIDPGSPLPALAPSLKVMAFCVATGTQIDIDLYMQS